MFRVLDDNMPVKDFPTIEEAYDFAVLWISRWWTLERDELMDTFDIDEEWDYTGDGDFIKIVEI